MRVSNLPGQAAVRNPTTEVKRADGQRLTELRAPSSSEQSQQASVVAERPGVSRPNDQARREQAVHGVEVNLQLRKAALRRARLGRVTPGPGGRATSSLACRPPLDFSVLPMPGASGDVPVLVGAGNRFFNLSGAMAEQILGTIQQRALFGQRPTRIGKFFGDIHRSSLVDYLEQDAGREVAAIGITQAGELVEIGRDPASARGRFIDIITRRDGSQLAAAQGNVTNKEVDPGTPATRGGSDPIIDEPDSPGRSGGSSSADDAGRGGAGSANGDQAGPAWARRIHDELKGKGATDQQIQHTIQSMADLLANTMIKLADRVGDAGQQTSRNIGGTGDAASARS